MSLRQARKRAEATNTVLENVSTQLAKYISPQLYASILSGSHEVRVESRRKKLTIFFSDIKGFTEISDQLEPEELTDILNEYLTEMTAISREYGANLDKFIGDAIVLYFGEPESLGVAEDARQCIRMAVDMQRRMEDLRHRWLDRGLERPLRIRVGINTGYCTVGNFGSDARMDHTMIGGEVNLAARLEQNADVGSILVSHETWSLIRDIVEAEEVGTLSVKGISQPVRTYRVLGLRDEHNPPVRFSGPGLVLSLERSRLDGIDRAEASKALRRALAALEQDTGAPRDKNPSS